MKPSDDQKPEVLDFWEADNIKRAAKIVSQGGPIGFAGFGVYGIGGIAKAFTESARIVPFGTMPSIGQLKNRNFYQRPPVAMASWTRLRKIVKWEKISNPKTGLSKQKVVSAVKKIYNSTPLILVLPIDPTSKDIFPFASLTEEKDLGHAFLCTEAYSPWSELAKAVEKKTGEIFLVTSANPSRIPTFTSYREVAETFPQLPLILADLRFDGSVQKIEWCSHSMYCFMNFPNVKILRSGNEAHSLIISMMEEIGLSLEINLSDPGKILTTEPAIDSLEAIKEILG